MKLKRLLCGVTASIMALSSIAVASFTSASAEDAELTKVYIADNNGAKLGDEVSITGDGEYEVTATGLNLTGDFAVGISGARNNLSTESQIVVNKIVVNDTECTVPKAFSSAQSPFNNKGAIDVFVYNAWNAAGSITLPSTPLKSISIKFTLSDTTVASLPTENISTMKYNFTVASDTNSTVNFTLSNTLKTSVAVAGPGDYSVTATVNAASIENVGSIECSEDVTLTVNTIVINDKYTINVNKELTTTRPYANGLANVWNDEGKADVVYKGENAYLQGGTLIRLITQAPPATEPSKPTPTEPEPTPGASYTAWLMFADSQYCWDNRNVDNILGTTANVTGNGTYKVGVDSSCIRTGMENNTPIGIEVLAVDIMGYGKAIGASTENLGSLTEAQARDVAKKAGLSITNVSIIVDGKKVYTYKDSDVMFGDIEGKGNIRLDLYNVYNESGAAGYGYDAPAEVQALALSLEPTDSVEVEFTLTYNKPAPTKPSASKPTTNVKPKPTAPKATRSKEAVAKDKAAAQKLMKQAKIKKLTVKSKAKKKITVTWKKVKKAKGYEVEVNTNKKFKKGKKVLSKLTSKKKLTIKNKKIKSGKKYYVRVRAYATYKNVNNTPVKVYSKWNKQLRTVKVK